MTVSEARVPPAGQASRPRLPNAVGFLMAIAFVWLAGQFVTQGLSDYFLDSDPGLAVLWRGDSADALTAFAEKQVAARRYELAARLAKKALQFGPLDAHTLAIYGFALDGSGQAAAADQVMTLAGQRSWRDPTTQIWLLRHRLLQGRYADGFQHIDALMRREQDPPVVLFRVLAAAARDPRAVAPLAKRLSYAPLWRDRFLLFLAADRDPAALDLEGNLLRRLAATHAPPTEQELGYYLARLIQTGDFQGAAQAWRTLSPYASPNRLINDGDFERTPEPTPFEWIMANGVGWSVQIAPAPAGGRGHALKIDYDGVSQSRPVEQFLVLPPGRYHLSGALYDETGQGAALLNWRVICLGSQQQLASAGLPSGQEEQWRAFGTDLEVPAQGCPAQWLQLSATPGDERNDVEVWYDNLAIVPIAPATAVAKAPQAPRP